MFEQLDEVDWASMNHAYGSAADVPKLIRNLASDDAEVRDRALHAAYGNIFHQGSRYEATAPTVPFLLEILEQPDYPGQAALLHLLTHLVMGYSESWIPLGVGDQIRGMRKELAELQARPAEVRANDPKDGLGWGTNEDWLRWMVDITDEARKGVPCFVQLLGSDDEYVRMAAAYMLSWLPEDLETFAPALWEVASNDESDTVRANALIALAIASGDETFEEYVEATEEMLAGAEPVVRFGAAVALGTWNPKTVPDAVVQVLLDAIARSGSDVAEEGEDWCIAWCDGDYGAHASAVLTLVCADDPARIVNAVSDALPGMQTLHAAAAAGTVLGLLFPDRFDDSAASLDPAQRRFLALLSDVRAPWFLGDTTFGNFSLTMSGFGLPGSMEELRKFLAP